MALKDMKSDLSKFRMPKKEPLKSKENLGINKNLNKTPLSSLAESAPKIPRSQTTSNKEGVNPQKVNQSEKFKGETSPTMVNQTEKFKGETSPTEMNNSEQFLGETSPKEANNRVQFLGETTPTEMNNESKFLGETTPSEMSEQSGEKFLGETTPSEMNNQSNFLGETTPNLANNESRFLGETTPSEMNNQSNFLGETTPTEMSEQSGDKFLGETTPNLANNESRFLGETTPTNMNNETQFLGETTPNSAEPSTQFLGETTPTSAEPSTQFLGETTPSDFTFSGKLENEGKEFKEVNNLTDIHAKGFNSKFGGVEASKFVGVNPNNTVFDGTTSLFGDISNNSFTLGKTYGGSYNDAGGINSGEDGFGIGMGQAKRQSPSFLDEIVTSLFFSLYLMALSMRLVKISINLSLSPIILKLSIL